MSDLELRRYILLCKLQHQEVGKIQISISEGFEGASPRFGSLAPD